MVYLVSVVMMLSLVICGIFFGMAPSMYNVIEQDLLRRATTNAKIEGLQIGQLIARSDPGKTNANLVFSTDLIRRNGILLKQLRTDITLQGGKVSVKVSAESPQ